MEPLQLLLLLIAFIAPFFQYLKRLQQRLPPGPAPWPLLGNWFDLYQSGNSFQELVRKTCKKYGPVCTIWQGTTPMIIIASRALAHETFVRNNVLFADRPQLRGFRKVFSSGGFKINAANNGQLLRALRSNLSAGILSQTSSTELCSVREWAVERLLKDLATEARCNKGCVQPREHLRDTIVRIVVTMCFGLRPDDSTLENIRRTTTLVHKSNFLVDNSLLSTLQPSRRKLAKELLQLRRETYSPLIKCALTSRKPSYAKSLNEAKIVEGRDLCEDEMISLCEEFVHAGSDSTFPTIEWAIFNLVKNRRIQRKLQDEIARTCPSERAPTDEDLKQMKYLQAIVLETLRRHPPSHLALNHAVSKPAKLAGFDIPAASLVNVDIFGIGTDREVWEDPLEFRPERFLEEGDDGNVTLCKADVTGSSKEVGFIPFSLGRRICPGMSLAMLHLQLILARLFHRFEWEGLPADDFDVSNKVVMTIFSYLKEPLRSVVTDRINSSA